MSETPAGFWRRRGGPPPDRYQQQAPRDPYAQALPPEQPAGYGEAPAPRQRWYRRGRPANYGGRPAAYPPADYPPAQAPPPASPSYQQVNVNGGGPGAYPQTWRSRLPNIAGPIGAILTVASGVLVLIATWLNWVAGVTGWGLMFRSFGTTGNFLFSWGPRTFLFSGFWSLLFGILIILGGLILFGDYNGSNLSFVAGIMGLLIAVTNIVIIYVNTGPLGQPGGGLWLFAIMSLLTAIFGATVVPRGGYYDAVP